MHSVRRSVSLAGCIGAVSLALVLAPLEWSVAQESSPDAGTSTPPAAENTAPETPDVVEVEPVAGDEEIVARLEKILTATGWFERPSVSVDEGVVFLRGRTEDAKYKTWAGDLARKTRDVVAVVNQIEVALPSAWDFQPAVAGIRDLGRDLIAWIPYMALALVIFALTFAAAVAVTRLLRSVLKERIRVPLLRDVIARGTGILVLLLGLYLVLRICGLTRLALTVLGGTGLFGLVLGIAFRDITENFLASILLSVQAPFRNGDLIEIAGATGFVQQLNVRTTVLMSPAGHYVQLPNSVVYKSTIRNYSTNPNRREDFTIGIGYEVPIVRAQEIALAVLDEHPGVLKTPEPWVLVDSLGSATVNLRIYFWIDGSQLSWLKVRSSVIRLVKRAYQDQGVTIPDEVREVIFPRGVPVQMVEAPKPSPPDANTASSASAPPDEAASVAAEGGLGTEARQIEEQASQAPASDASHDLLRPS